MKSFLLPEGTRKIFINVCYNDAVAEASSTPGKDSQQQRGEHWSIPYTISPPREDVDKGRVRKEGAGGVGEEGRGG